jgi:hypothetical protein
MLKRSLFAGLTLAMLLTVAAGTAGAASHGAVTCRHGTVSAGQYQSLTIAGACTLTGKGTVTVRGNLVVGHHALFNAITPGTLHVGGNVSVADDATAGIGCSPAIGCKVTTADTIGGNLTANGAWAVIVHSTRIGGNVSMMGGGGSMNCGLTPLFGSPWYSDIEDSTVGGWVSVRQLHSCWFGFIRNTVGSSVTIAGDRMGDPDANEIVTNHIGGNLACFDNSPAPQVGDSQGAPNVVLGHKLGQCAHIH